MLYNETENGILWFIEEDVYYLFKAVLVLN
jgi:hypothetical protein